MEEKNRDAEEEKSLQLGGNIELSGFNGFEPAVMIVLKKIIGNYARRISEKCQNFEKLSITIKRDEKKYELHAKMIENGKPYTASYTDKNLFVAVDASLKAIMNAVS